MSDHENPIDEDDVTDDERAKLLEEYLFERLEPAFNSRPLLMPLDEDGKAPIIKDRCSLDSDEARGLLVEPKEAYRRISEEGARGFALYAGRKGHGTDRIAFVDHDSDEFEAPTGEPTLEVLSGSGRGVHETYRNDYDDPVRNARVGDDLGEIRAKNWYVVLPGSIHPSGGVYHVHEDRPVVKISDAELTDEMRPAGGQADDTESNVDESTTGVPDVSEEASAALQSNSWIGTYLAIGGADDRSRKDFAVCKALIEHGVDEEDAYKLLNSSDHTKVDERGVQYWRRTWKNAQAKADTATDGGVSAATPMGSNTEDTGADAHIDEKQAGGPTWDQVKSLFAAEDNGTTTRAYSVAADILCRNYDFISIRESEEFYYYNADVGYYVRKGETFAKELLYDNLAGYVNESRTRNIIVEVTNRNYLDKASEFTPPENKVNVRNGVINLDAIETDDQGDLDVTREDVLEPHSPEYYFTAALDVDFDPTASGGLWVEQLERAIDDDGERAKLEEFIGYCLEQWHHDREKNMFLVGPSKSGKSTVQEAIQALFGGQPTVSNLTPQQIADTSFDAASLFESTLNTVNDINASKIEDTGTLKRVWSGESTKLENKFKDAFFAAPKAKHLFTANWLPRMVGQDEAIYRRVLIIEFMNTIDEDDLDRSVKKQMQNEPVRQVLLNRALEARERLYEQHGFTNDRTLNDTRKKWDSWRDGHKRFLYTQFEVTGDSDQTVGKDAYYQAFKEFVGRTGYAMKSKVAITKALQWVPEVQVNDDTYGGLEWRDTDAAENMGDDTTNDNVEDYADEDADAIEPTAVQAVAQVVNNEGDIRFVELRATLGARHDLDPDVAKDAIERAVETGKIIEEESGLYRPA